MDVYWLEQSEADVPQDLPWLSSSEAATLNAMHFMKRYNDWRLGRWTAKRTVSVYLEQLGQILALSQIEIRPASSGAPEIFCAGRRTAVTISLSHSAGIAFCAVAPNVAQLGCDLEAVEPRSELFVADYFTAEEQALIAAAPKSEYDLLATLLWSAKESALKALGEGLRLDTRSVRVDEIDRRAPHDSWRPLRIHAPAGRVFHGWWRSAGSRVHSIVADPPPEAPRWLLPASLPCSLIH